MCVYELAKKGMIMEILTILIGALIGYIIGACKAFREAKQKAYQEILPPILKFAFRSSQMKEGEYCEALCKLWLYGNKKVTKKMDYALWIAHDPSRGNMTKALQEVIVEMRKDIQLLSCQTIKPEDVQHLFTRISNN
jgi:hypothetical protein